MPSISAAATARRPCRSRRWGADTTGIDIARNLVAAGNARAKALGLANLAFHEGDACALTGVPDHRFDLTLSIFGAMFAPKPFEVAKEMVRVTKPGGRIVMGNWIPNDPTSFVSQVLKISSAFTPPPPEGFVSPMTWGVESHIVERFGQAGVPADRIAMEKDTFHFRTPDHAPADLIDAFRIYYGPTMNAYAAAEKNGQGRRPASAAGGLGDGAERCERRRHVDLGDLHAGDGPSLTDRAARRSAADASCGSRFRRHGR